MSEVNESESSMRCRNWLDGVKTAASDKPHEQGLPRFSGKWVTGIRHIDDTTDTSGFYTEQENLSC